MNLLGLVGMGGKEAAAKAVGLAPSPDVPEIALGVTVGIVGFVIAKAAFQFAVPVVGGVLKKLLDASGK